MKSARNSLVVGLTAALLLIVGLQAAVAQTVTRGAYLQVGTPDSIVLRWRTDQATASTVNFGDAPGNLTSGVTDNT